MSQRTSGSLCLNEERSLELKPEGYQVGSAEAESEGGASRLGEHLQWRLSGRIDGGRGLWRGTVSHQYMTDDIMLQRSNLWKSLNPRMMNHACRISSGSFFSV